MRRWVLSAMALLVAAASAVAQGDELLATAVHEALARDRRVDAEQVRVEAKASTGAVRLLGEVDSAQEREAAGEAARRVPGVRSVENELTVAASVAPAPGTSPIPEQPAR
jgi:osmotically-inducible protein OsmY